jgi:3-dehydroquinate synthase
MNPPRTEIFTDSTALLRRIKKQFEGKRIFILTDENVSSACLHALLHEFNSIGEIDVIEVEAGETSKSLSICDHLWSHLIESNCSKSDLILNFGGGVITDLGGFVASNFKRGIPFIHVPTSLMAMTDAAIGGKTGIDHLDVKNVIGTFALPEAILVNTSLLETLPMQEIKSGFAEMLKHALISNKTLWQSLLKLESVTYKTIIPFLSDSIKIKEEIVNSDFEEKGQRKLLNFGHTLGHALESSYLRQNKPISHGEAVALGMVIETAIAHRIGHTNKEHSDAIIASVTKHFPLENYQLPNFAELIPFILNDKKNAGDKIMLTLVSKPGEASYNIELSMETIQEAYTIFHQ